MKYLSSFLVKNFIDCHGIRKDRKGYATYVVFLVSIQAFEDNIG